VLFVPAGDFAAPKKKKGGNESRPSALDDILAGFS
jgi:hypothetical protein